MDKKRRYKYLENYLFDIQTEGRLFFSIKEIQKKFTGHSLNSIQMNLKRLNKKGMIKHIMKGFYVIIVPEYSARKILPPELFIDALFNHLNRKYYVGLLSAAFYHGSSHQQPQEYFLMIEKPTIRNLLDEGLKINFIVNSNLPNCEIENKKSRTGYFKISTVEQTVYDLIDYQNRIGGLNRAANLIHDLLDKIRIEKLCELLNYSNSLTVIQRLGYIFDYVLERQDFADQVKKYLQGKMLYSIPLAAGLPKSGFPINKRWKIFENYKIELDL